MQNKMERKYKRSIRVLYLDVQEVGEKAYNNILKSEGMKGRERMITNTGEICGVLLHIEELDLEAIEAQAVFSERQFLGFKKLIFGARHTGHNVIMVADLKAAGVE